MLANRCGLEVAMKLPGPDHPIMITPNPKRVVVTFDGHEIANSTHALTLKESTYPAVLYIPRADVDMALLERTAHGSHCPYKGDANYFAPRRRPCRGERGVDLRNAVRAVAPIKDHLAFYRNRVDAIEERPPDAVRTRRSPPTAARRALPREARRSPSLDAPPRRGPSPGRRPQRCRRRRSGSGRARSRRKHACRSARGA